MAASPGGSSRCVQEQLRVDAGALVAEALHEPRAQAGRLDGAAEAAALVDAGAVVEQEQVLQGDHLALHADDLGHVGDAPAAVLQPALVHDQVDRARDLLPDGAHRQVEAGHQHHRLQAGERVTGRVGVDGGERAVVAGVHRLQHVERLATADLTDHDPVRPHPQRVADQVADGDLALALEVGRPVLQPQPVRLAELQLGGVLDGDDALAGRQVGRQDVEGGGLAAAGAAGDQHVQPPVDAAREERGGLGGQGAEGDQVLGLVGVRGELPHGQVGAAADAQRGDHRVDAGAVGQPGVHVRGALVDAAPDLADHLVDHPAQVGLVHEAAVGREDVPLPLDVDDVGRVHHDLGDAAVAQERLDRAEAEHVVGDLGDQPLALVTGQRRLLVLQGPLQQLAHLGVELLRRELRVVQLRPDGLDQRPMHLLAQLGQRIGLDPVRLSLVGLWR